MSRETLVQITTPYFCAGVVARDGIVREAAPIVRYMKGWDGIRVADYCRSKGWSWVVVSRSRNGECPPASSRGALNVQTALQTVP